MQVIAKLHPKLPSHPLAAAAWVALLGAGHLDARAYAEQATALLQGLWAATQHAHAEVRGALAHCEGHALSRCDQYQAVLLVLYEA